MKASPITTRRYLWTHWRHIDAPFTNLVYMCSSLSFREASRVSKYPFFIFRRRPRCFCLDIRNDRLRGRKTGCSVKKTKNKKQKNKKKKREGTRVRAHLESWRRPLTTPRCRKHG